eukprot:6212461-Pleurochrysis_carterae.AAC.2
MVVSRLSIDEWGPGAWAFLHAVTYAYPHEASPTDKAKYADFFTSIPDVLPCEKCARHFRKAVLHDNGSTLLLALRGRRYLTRWLIDIHNNVNFRNGKSNMTYDDVDWLYRPVTQRAFSVSSLKISEVVAVSTVCVFAAFVCSSSLACAMRRRSCNRC